MSAYMVKLETINELSKITRIEPVDLISMNAYAVRQRYNDLRTMTPEQTFEKFNPLPEGKTVRDHYIDVALAPKSQPSDIQLIKSINCYLYQCSEGDTLEVYSDLYIVILEAKNKLLTKIAEKSPVYRHEYDLAEWD